MLGVQVVTAKDNCCHKELDLAVAVLGLYHSSDTMVINCRHKDNQPLILLKDLAEVEYPARQGEFAP
jgi:hypothetical protein